MPHQRHGDRNGSDAEGGGRVPPEISRRQALRLGAGAVAAAALGPPLGGGRPAGRAPDGGTPQTALIHRTIPSSGEEIPAVGLGTWQTFDVGESDRERAPLREVLRSFEELGGTVVDSSPMYGASQVVLGDLAAELGVLDDLWVATKVWIRGRQEGIDQMEHTMDELRSDPVELMQVHNLRDVDVHLDTLERWRARGRIRYTGITTSSGRQYEEVADLLERERDRLDFLQVNYSLAERRSADRLLPMARERGIAVMINRPFAGGRLFGRVRGRELPTWASEIDCRAWSQIFLKYVLSHPAVTCAIPATSDPGHLRENMGGGRGRLPDPALRRRMEEAVGG
ncbi:MAG: aldo/keto reductase [Gemmatimonadetes bacterium]|nr:aldo/keto reductase [Gemmatimonadota bacterium]NIR79939.1 aldo/keto reductase [Gemmatimonadota bacterium]NIT88658.1 aldo/keto reductase [Gemmatimonadota bacterium]NIU32474.1 aldo/keto reductase [Gemmatimonadota bacterium]NIU36959.1 aldo/keto reductase [Gemmatimonadota bacterium]